MAIIGVNLVVIAVGVWFLFIRSDDGDTNPATVEMPPVEQGAETTGYFAGEGQPLADYVAAARVLEDPMTGAACTELVDGEFTAIGTPEELVALAVQVPDEATADMAVSYLYASFDALSACVNGVANPTDDLSFQGEVLRRRLGELGVVGF